MSQVLSQDEINALLSGLSDSPAEEAAEEKEEGMRKYDLASQERIIRGRMPTMELIHDRFSRSFRNALAKFLGRTCFINIGGIEITKFGQFMKKLPLPSSLHIYRMPPLMGYGLLVVSSPMVFGMVDTLFGGKGVGRVKIEGREYTSIETRLIGKVVMMALENLKEAWSPVHPVDFVYVRSEFNPLAVAIVAPTDVVIIVTVEIELEQQSTTLTVCIPYSIIEPIRQKLITGFQSNRLEVDNSVLKRMEVNLQRTDVNLSVQLAKGNVKTRELMDLKVGSVLQLDSTPKDEAVIRVEGVPKYLGYVGTFRGSKAVKITKPIINNEQKDRNAEN
ncbi:MAG: flagellar motor switch protein FliM [Proteobacteria bacterium]|nr:flagellar motor switch protein FliM [Pseudomonadota bacterium]